jgi:hypothetical protein
MIARAGESAYPLAISRALERGAARIFSKESPPLVRFSKAVFAIALIVVSFAAVTASADEYKFKVTNNTDTLIKKILVSEDGEEYGYFDIGSGIKPGKTVELVWDSSTNGESCEQYFKAVFSNDEESEPTVFDFCESEVALEFE